MAFMGEYMNVNSGTIIDVREADIDNGTYLGELVEELGNDVISTVIGLFREEAVDFGGGIVDIPVSAVMDRYGDSPYRLAKDAKVKRSVAKGILEVCDRYKNQIVAYG